MTVSYTVDVKTGCREYAGTYNTVFLRLIGTSGKAGPFAINKYWIFSLIKGKAVQFKFHGNDVGDVLMVTIEKSGGHIFDNDWFVDEITITKFQKSRRVVFNFPCFRWVTDEKELTVFEGTAILPCSDQNKVLKEQRKAEVQNNRTLYKWGSDPKYSKDLPGFIEADRPEDLPKDSQFTSADSDSLFDSGINGFLNVGLGHLHGVFDKWDSFTDFENIFNPGLLGPLPPATEQWRDDTWVGSQFLNGCNPEMIKKCTALPEKFPVTNEMVSKQLDRGTTLDQQMQANRIYMVDYEILDGIPTFCDGDDVRYIMPAMGLFFLRRSGNLVPIAIQLHQVPGEGNPIWTPDDNEYDWLNAKLWLRAADTQHHQMISHLLRCHLMMEPIAVASWRQLPSLHPVWKLLHPHIRGVMAINALGRQKLIGKGGIADKVLSIGGGGHLQIMQKHYRSVTWKSYDLPQCLEDRGVRDPEHLPNFHYRDDALKLWYAIENFIKEIINIYYSSDDDVVKDDEIQNWARDLHENGYPSNGNHDKGFPASFSKREELIHFLTMAVFTSSCQHAAVNFSQKDVYGFHPNSPSLMRQECPREKGVVTLESTLDTLATQHQASIMVFIVNQLTTMYPDEETLGTYEGCLFTDFEAKEAIVRFGGEMEDITSKIQERNMKLKWPYEYLLPTRIPNSIAI